MQPSISVCIPTYRGAATLGAAIESVLAQTRGDFELIVVDDASPDDTPATVGRYQDARVRHMRNARNLGPEGNWNRCLELASGRYLKLLPHDDLLHPQCLERQAAVLDADREGRLALVCAARDVIGPRGDVLVAARGLPGLREPTVLDREAVLHACWRHGTNVIGEPGAVLFRHAAARHAGRFDAQDPYVIDLDYWLRLLQHGGACCLPEALASFRVWGGSWSVRIGMQQPRQFLRMMRRMHACPPAGVSVFEAARGRVAPWANAVARQLFYRLWVR